MIAPHRKTEVPLSSIEPALVRRCLLFARAAGLAGVIVGGVVLAGWLLNIQLLKSPMSGGTMMMGPHTAVCFLLLGASLWLSVGGARLASQMRRMQALTALVCSVAVSILGLATLSQDLLGLDFGIDELLFPGQLSATGLVRAGRMSPATASSLVVLGLALALIDLRSHLMQWGTELLALAATFIGFVALLGYLYDVQALYDVTSFSYMPLHAVLLFITLGAGALFARPEGGLLAPILSVHGGGVMARRVVPVAIVLPAVVGWLRLAGQRAGWYGTEAGLALFAIANVLIFSVVVWLAARSLNRSDTERQRAEARAIQLVRALDDFSDAVIGLDLDSRITTWSGAADHMTGYQEHEVVGRIADFLIPKSKPEERLDLLRRVRLDESHIYQCKLISKRGELLEVEICFVPVHDEHGALVGQLSITRDITERKRAEEALVAERTLLRTLIDALPDVVFTKDLKGAFTLSNAAALRHLGIAREEELAGKSVFDLYRRELAEVYHADDLKALGGQAILNREELSVNAAGNSGWYLTIKTPLRDHAGAIIGLVGISRDITERKAMEETLRESERRFRALIEHNADSISVVDQHNNIQYVSPAVAAVEGYAPDELVGRNGFENTHPDDLQLVQGIVQQLVANPGKPIPVLWRRRHKNGQWLWLEGVATNLLHDPAVRGIVTNYRDISARRRAEESQLRSQKMEALGTLAGGIAHDFNNILLAIAGNTKLAIDDLPADHPVQLSLVEIEKASVRASDLVRRILTFTRQEEPKREILPLRPVVEEVLKLLRSTLPAMIEIRTDFAANLPAVAADATQIHQVVLNLATNAAHAIGGRGGLIEVRLDTVNLSAEMAPMAPDLREGHYVRLSVSDNGCGMDNATRERIFDPFFTTKAVGAGTGLGLSTVHGIVKSHDGTISVYSALSKGTTFHLYFPAVEEAIATIQSPQREIARGRGQRLLYVDDESPLVLLATRVLSRLGYNVTGHTDPLQALKAFQANPHGFDVVVTDLSMPGMSGFELGRAILQARPDVPLLMTSGYVRPEDQATASHLGIRDMILKPNTFEELAQVLDGLCRALPGEASEGNPHSKPSGRA